MIQLGGAVAKTMNIVDPLSIFVLSLLVFLLKCYLVQWSYNSIFPLLRYNLIGVANQPFIEFNFTQAIILVILANNLFVM
jgi:hypothetical protein